MSLYLNSEKVLSSNFKQASSTSVRASPNFRDQTHHEIPVETGDPTYIIPTIVSLPPKRYYANESAFLWIAHFNPFVAVHSIWRIRATTGFLARESWAVI